MITNDYITEINDYIINECSVPYTLPVDNCSRWSTVIVNQSPRVQSDRCSPDLGLLLQFVTVHIQ